MAIVLACILGGALLIQFFLHEIPCPLCLLQRVGMLGVASGALLNVRFLPAKRHYGVSLFFAVFGGFTALRQFFLHVCPGFPTFGEPFWGLSLYTWSFLVFACSVLYIAILLMVFNGKQGLISDKHHPNWWGNLAFLLVFLVAFVNIIASLWQCGLSACTDV